MMPPTQEMVDPCCHGSLLCLSTLMTLLSKTDAAENLKRCERKSTIVALDAPYARWVQGGEFETLAECKASQEKPLTRNETAWAGLAGDLMAGEGVSKDDLIRMQEAALTLSKCLASDDPRLKGN
jgi:hypothetical protein